MIFTALYYRQYNPIKTCESIQPGVNLDQLIAALGTPINKTDSWYYFSSAFGAAGPIRAKISQTSGKVLALKCTEDGETDWAVK